jgi:beta-glucosidase
MFEHPYADAALTAKVGSAEHRAVARDCVRQSLVLLKNEKHTLPLAKTLKHLLVVGKAADDMGIQCGGWTIDWQGKPGPVIHGGTTILAGIKQALGPAAQITFSADGSALKSADENGGARPDAVLAFVGELPYAEGKGDRKDLNLSAQDVALVEKAKKTGAPVVVVLISGRPMILGPTLEASDAFIAAWLPGTQGEGVADVLFGDYHPTGKLPHTWPRTMDQVPLHADDAGAEKALFSYGFGLSY